MARTPSTEISTTPPQNKIMRIIDFHSHILAGVDHGSRVLSESIAQLETISASGTDAVVATSHFSPYSDKLRTFLEKRERAISIVAKHIPKGLDVYVGAEVLLCPGLDRFEELSDLCIVGTKTLLIEMPTHSWTQGLIATLHRIAALGYNVVIAHLDRYKKELAERLLDCGFSYQINAGSLYAFGSRRRNRKYLSLDGAVALGSDLHGTDGYDAFAHAVKDKKLNASKIMAKTEALLLGAIPVRVAEE